jgi:hypothetical protein
VSETIPDLSNSLGPAAKAYYVSNDEIQHTQLVSADEHDIFAAASILVSERSAKFSFGRLVYYLLRRAIRAERQLDVFARKIDIQLNGVDGAASHPRPIDVLSQMRKENIRSTRKIEDADDVMYMISDPLRFPGMVAGPTPALTDMLRHDGETGQCILRSVNKASKMEVVFIWEGDAWINPPKKTFVETAWVADARL